MPVTIKLALIATIVANVIGLLDAALQGTVTRQDSPTGNLGAALVGMLINVVFVLFIAMRHNWARWVYSVLTLIGLPFVIPILLVEIGTDPVGAASTVLQMALLLASVVLLFVEPSRQWFAQEAPAAR